MELEIHQDSSFDSDADGKPVRGPRREVRVAQGPFDSDADGERVRRSRRNVYVVKRGEAMAVASTSARARDGGAGAATSVPKSSGRDRRHAKTDDAPGTKRYRESRSCDRASQQVNSGRSAKEGTRRPSPRENRREKKAPPAAEVKGHRAKDRITRPRTREVFLEKQPSEAAAVEGQRARDRITRPSTRENRREDHAPATATVGRSRRTRAARTENRSRTCPVSWCKEEPQRLLEHVLSAHLPEEFRPKPPLTYEVALARKKYFRAIGQACSNAMSLWNITNEARLRLKYELASEELWQEILMHCSIRGARPPATRILAMFDDEELTLTWRAAARALSLLSPDEAKALKKNWEKKSL